MFNNPNLGTVYALVFGCDRQTMWRMKWTEIKVHHTPIHDSGYMYQH